MAAEYAQLVRSAASRRGLEDADVAEVLQEIRIQLWRALGSQALDTLAPTQRPVVRMYLAGYPQAEIQTLLGWSEPKTRNVLYRGLQQLRETLSQTGIRPGAAR